MPKKKPKVREPIKTIHIVDPVLADQLIVTAKARGLITRRLTEIVRYALEQWIENPPAAKQAVTP